MTNRNYSSIDGKDLLDKNNKFKISKIENIKCSNCEAENKSLQGRHLAPNQEI